jgi:hypothetical protein
MAPRGASGAKKGTDHSTLYEKKGDSVDSARLSARYFAASAYTSRLFYYGDRGVRSAP